MTSRNDQVYPFRRALVTGASSGIGAAMGHLLGKAGVPAVLVARRRERLEELAEQYDGFEVLVADLTTNQGLAAVAARLADSESPIDLLVNNAGFGTSGPLATAEPGRTAKEIGLNVTALTLLTQAALPGMLHRERGWVLNVSSVAGFQAGPNLAVYSATKAYVTLLSESLHEELRGTGVLVTALCPGLTRTEFQEVSNTETYADRYPGFAWMDADEVAEVGLRDCAKGKAVSVPGLIYKGLVSSVRLFPRGLTRRVAGAATGRVRSP